MRSTRSNWDGSVVLFVILHVPWSERLLEDGLKHCGAHAKPSLDSVFLYKHCAVVSDRILVDSVYYIDSGGRRSE